MATRLGYFSDRKKKPKKNDKGKGKVRSWSSGSAVGTKTQMFFHFGIEYTKLIYNILAKLLRYKE